MTNKLLLSVAVAALLITGSLSAAQEASELHKPDKDKPTDLVVTAKVQVSADASPSFGDDIPTETTTAADYLRYKTTQKARLQALRDSLVTTDN